jgi:hypothetical protein
LAIGTAGQILTVNSGATAPQWSTLSGVAVTTFSAGTTGFTPSSATAGAVTLAGTLATTNGGTGLTSFTSGGVVYASSSSALATGSGLVFDATNGVLGLGISSGFRTAGGYGIQAINGSTGALIDLYTGGVRLGGVFSTGVSTGISAINALPLTFSTTDTERGRFSASGQFSIGTTGTLNYGTRLSVLGTTNAGYGAEFYVPGSNNTTKIAFANDSSIAAIGSIVNNLVFYAPAATEVGRFTSSGSLLVSTTAENYTASIITASPITTTWSGTIALRYNVSGQTNAYYKGMTGTSIQNASARGLHIFNYDQDSNPGILFYPSSYAGQTADPAVIINPSGNFYVGATSALNGANFQISVGSGASSTPYAAVFNTATSPTASASTRFDLGFLNGASNYVATGTTLGYINFMGQANDNGYGGAFVQAYVTSGGNVARASGHSIDLIFGTKSSSSAGAVEALRITSDARVSIGTSASGNYTKVNTYGGPNVVAYRVFDGNHDASTSTFIYPITAYYARRDNNQRFSNPIVTDATNGAGATAVIAFTDRPGTGTYPYNVRTSDILFYTALNNGNSGIDANPYLTMQIYAEGTIQFNRYGAGTLSTNASGVVSASDGRMKTKTRDLTEGLSKIRALAKTTMYYLWNEDTPMRSEHEEIGWAAQDVAAVIPEASPDPGQDKFRNYHDRAVIAYMAKAIDELAAQIESLKTA